MPRLLAILLSCLALLATPATAIELSPEEQAWLQNHRQLSLGIDASWPPFEFRDSQGHYQGLAAGYVRLLEERLQIKLHGKESKDRDLTTGIGHLDIV